MTPFSKSQAALLALIRKSFDAAPDFDFASLSADDWEQISLESRAQTADLIAFDATKGLAVPDAVAFQWLTKSAAIFSKNLKIVIFPQKKSLSASLLLLQYKLQRKYKSLSIY